MSGVPPPAALQSAAHSRGAPQVNATSVLGSFPPRAMSEERRSNTRFIATGRMLRTHPSLTTTARPTPRSPLGLAEQNGEDGSPPFIGEIVWLTALVQRLLIDVEADRISAQDVIEALNRGTQG
jgi:hypothetical protein